MVCFQDDMPFIIDHFTALSDNIVHVKEEHFQHNMIEQKLTSFKQIWAKFSVNYLIT